MKIWVSDEAGHLVGYCKVGPNSLPCDPARPHALELSRLYLLPGYQNRQLGQVFMKKVIIHAASLEHDEIVLSVYQENYGAQRFYRRYGFELIGEYGFQVGNHIDPEFIFLKSL